MGSVKEFKKEIWDDPQAVCLKPKIAINRERLVFLTGFVRQHLSSRYKHVELRFVRIPRGYEIRIYPRTKKTDSSRKLVSRGQARVVNCKRFFKMVREQGRVDIASEAGSKFDPVEGSDERGRFWKLVVPLGGQST